MPVAMRKKPSADKANSLRGVANRLGRIFRAQPLYPWERNFWTEALLSIMGFIGRVSHPQS